LDPGFALGYATLVETQLNLMTFAQEPQAELLANAGMAADRAVTLDPLLAEAQAAQAYILQANWKWREAEVHFQKALTLKPSYAAARRRYAGLLLQFGRIAEAVPMAEQAFTEDPYDRGAIPAMGLYYFLAGRYEESARFLRTQIGQNDMQAARHNLGDSLAEVAVRAHAAERNRYFQEALQEAARVTAIESKSSGVTPMGDEMFAHYYLLSGDSAAAEPYMSRLLTALERGQASPAIVAWIYAVRGDRERAIDLLEQALAARDRRLMYVKLFPALSSLHGHPRFESIIARMQL
jgi:tetratricopeptide (TPR) repeat protein